MSGRIGADPESLDVLADQLRGFSESLRSSRRNLTSGVHERAWKGARADRFRSDWDHTYVPWMDSACDFLEQASKVLHDNANQQRVASGGSPKDYSPPHHRSLWDRAVGGIEDVADAGTDWVADRVDDAGRDLQQISEYARQVVSTVVASDAFAYAIDGLEVVAAVAPLLALTGVGAPLALGIAAAASGLVLAGHMAQMANSGEWDGWQIAGDSFGLAGSMVGLGAAAKILPEVSIVGSIGKDLTNTMKGVVAFKSVQEAFNVADTGHDVYVDLENGNYGRAGLDGALGLLGMGSDATSGTASDVAGAISGAGGAAEDAYDTYTEAEPASGSASGSW